MSLLILTFTFIFYGLWAEKTGITAQKRIGIMAHILPTIHMGSADYGIVGSVHSGNYTGL